MENIRETDISVLETFFVGIGEKSFRAKQVHEWLWKKGARSFDDMTNLSKPIREKLKLKFVILPAEIVTKQTSKDNVIKVLFRLPDNEHVEGVLIPSKERVTACISSQAGCKLGCTFCATGTAGFTRDLSCPEIYDQVYLLNELAMSQYGHHLSNIVLMGMGEPLLNYDNVLQAINIITSEKGLGFSPKRITLSTVGISNKIKRLADEKVKFNLAVSLHSANQKKREKFVPVAKANPLPLLMNALQYFNEKTATRVTFEYMLMHDVNDRLEDAKELAEYCKGIPCKVNLIEYNPVKNKPYGKSKPDDTAAFKTFLEQRNMIVNIRSSRGTDIAAACGQLAGKLR